MIFGIYKIGNRNLFEILRLQFPKLIQSSQSIRMWFEKQYGVEESACARERERERERERGKGDEEERQGCTLVK